MHEPTVTTNICAVLEMEDGRVEKETDSLSNVK